MRAVMRLHVQSNSMALFENHTGSPNFGLDRDDLSRFELLLFIMRVIGPIRRRKLGVELTMRDFQEGQMAL
jgi:hypothetical protein